MNQLLLTPIDTLFFRDGRPMEGSLAGHGADWPLPTVANAALHAALHDARRCGHIPSNLVHQHDHMRSNNRVHKDVRAFGSLTTAGPFPVSPHGTWMFPRPLDLMDASLAPTLTPQLLSGHSSLPKPLTHSLVSGKAPTKSPRAKAWLSLGAYEDYLRGSTAIPQGDRAKDTEDVYLAETSIGIAIDPETGTAGQGDTEGKIYSSYSLRLREGWRLGLLAQTKEKQPDGSRRDLIVDDLFCQGRRHIILGGQQRVCTVEPEKVESLPLPRGLSKAEEFRQMPGGKYMVKWILLSPAIFPKILPGRSKRGTERQEHPGGWLPTWIDPHTGRVLLEVVDASKRLERRRCNYKGNGYQSSPDVPGQLIAARIDKPVPVTGWSIGDEELAKKSFGETECGEEGKPGAKSTHLAVSAGAIYYFACETADEARVLASALNWHGSDPSGSIIKNRRSTLLGEKGFGLGVCGTWTPVEGPSR
jgi:CRISPR-associated protein Cmr3